jgi:hypothetical protein
MAISYLLAALLAWGSLSQAATVTELDRNAGMKKHASGDCGIEISFDSYASGIDRSLFAKTKEAVGKDERLQEAFTWPWGKEGERILCLNGEGKKLDAAFADLKSQLKKPVSGLVRLKRKGKPPLTFHSK